MSIEEEKIVKQRIVREDLKIYIGALLEVIPERNHTTIYFEFNPSKGAPQKCTQCNGDNPVTLRYERDHNADVFYDAFCVKCSPKTMLEKIPHG